MRILAVDFGFRRIGLAVGETQPFVAGPRKPLSASGALKKDAEAIAKLAKTEEAELILVGLPIAPDGTEGRMARLCRTLAAEIEQLGRPVRLIDERLSSKEADRSLHEAGLKASQRRKLVDGEAAIVLLERFMNAEAPI